MTLKHCIYLNYIIWYIPTYASVWETDTTSRAMNALISTAVSLIGTAICSRLFVTPAPPRPCPAPRQPPLCLLSIELACIFCTAYKCNHTACILCCLAYFSQHNYFESHPSCCTYQQFFYLLFAMYHIRLNYPHSGGQTLFSTRPHVL